MGWKEVVNSALSGVSGYELTRRGEPGASNRRRGDRQLRSPIFLHSSVRSGSTLLRVILNGHSELFAPHELHLVDLKVELATHYVEEAMEELGFTQRSLENLLWDRVMARALDASGKTYIVNKTPNNVFIWRRIASCWPDARYIFLIRHPASICQSWHSARKQWTEDEAVESTLKYVERLEEARSELQGVTVKYEDLTADPEREIRRICAHLEIEYEPEMIDYGSKDHGKMKAGLGDWTGKIKSGKLQEARPLPNPDDVPKRLREISAKWGYMEPESVTD
ncbi:MAG TPA: sulfotransferase [Streptosporangiaceae bacterium]|jgi:hypothetical protein